MKNNSLIFSAVASSFCLISPVVNAAISIDGSNLVGFDSSTSAVVDNGGNVITNGTGVVSIGTFGSLTDGQIQALSSGAAISASFTTLSSVTMGTGVGLDGLWSTSFDNVGDTSSLAGQAVFTLVGNAADIDSSDQFFIYRHSGLNGDTGTFVEDPGNNEAATVAQGANGTGSIVVGGHGNFDYDFGAGDVAAFNLVTVPEPSSTALLGLGGVAFLLRRRR